MKNLYKAVGLNTRASRSGPRQLCQSQLDAGVSGGRWREDRQLEKTLGVCLTIPSGSHLYLTGKYTQLCPTASH